MTAELWQPKNIGVPASIWNPGGPDEVPDLPIEWWMIGTSYVPDGVDRPIMELPWDENIGETFGFNITSFFLYDGQIFIRPHIVARVNPDIDNTIVDEEIDTAGNAPTIVWTSGTWEFAESFGSPVVTIAPKSEDAADHVWRIVKPTTGVADTWSGGVLEIFSGPLKLVITFVSNLAPEPYGTIAWEYQWDPS